MSSAAVAGAKRILDVKGVRDVPPGVIIWSMVETAVTLVCVGIPVCRPLLGQIMKKISTSRGSKRSKSPSHDPNNGAPAPIGLHTFGGSPMQPGAAAGHRRRRDIVSDLFSRLAPSTGVFSRATVPTTTKSRAVGDDPTGDGQSEQAIMNHGADCCKDDVEAHGGHHSSSSSRDLDVDEKDGHLARECTRSWIIGESINRNEVSSSGPEGEHKDDIIMTSKSYEVKRGESPV